jgi:hypothetical protein
MGGLVYETRVRLYFKVDTSLRSWEAQINYAKQIALLQDY